MRTIEILEKLIAFPTVSSASNLDLIDFVFSYLRERGAECLTVPNEDGHKANLCAILGPKGLPGVMLSAHTDVVPVDDQAWSSDPFKLTVRGGKAYGRGTADMKGFLAACLSLADRTTGIKLKSPLIFAFSYDEEIGCIGVRTLLPELAKLSPQPRFCIVGEPTSLRIATGHKGKLSARATCHGVAAHSAFAPQALNAIHLACDLISFFRVLQTRIAHGASTDSDYDVPYATLHVGRINGGTAVNIVPNRCTVDFEIRNLAQDDARGLLQEIVDAAQRITESARKGFPEAGIEIEVINEYPGLLIERDAETVTFVKELTGEVPTLKVAFGTEGGLFAQDLGLPVVIFGPGSIAQAHKADEYISVDQLDGCDRMMDCLRDHLAG